MAYNLGVDLGTSTISAAVHDRSGVRPAPLGDRSVVEPAVVYLRGDGTLITGRHASSRTVSSPGRVARGVLRHLADPDPVYLGDRPFAVPELLAAMLRAALSRVAENEGGPPRRVVLTHPAGWSAEQRRLFGQAAALAGIDDPELVTASQAACARHAWSGAPGSSRPVAVYDLGGGSLDVAAVVAGHDGPRLLGTPGGDPGFGGIDLDRALVQAADERSGGQMSALDPRARGTATARVRLRQDCIRARELLSVEPEVRVLVVLLDRHVEVRITRADLESLARARIGSTVESTTAVLDSARLHPRELGAVLVLGGTARMPLVTSMLTRALGRPVGVDERLTHAVAFGGAALAGAPGVSGAVLAPVPVWNPPARDPTAGPDTGTAPAGTAPAGTAPAGTAPAGTAPAGTASPAPRDAAGVTAVGGSGGGGAAGAVDSARNGAALPGPGSSPGGSVGGNTSGGGPTGSGTTGSGAAGSNTGGLVAAGGSAGSGPAAARSRRSRRGPLIAAAVVLLAAGAGLAFGSGPAAPARPAALSLSTSAVRVGDSYTATATGFDPTESVQLSWAGPTNGVMEAEQIDPSGAGHVGPVIERDPPGRYLITARGTSTGRTATATLDVLPGPKRKRVR